MCIGIIDYGVGNLRSVQKALERVGFAATILHRPEALARERGSGAVEKVVLPGVGAFADGMRLLGERGWVEPVRAHVAAGRPLLGICLGMQLLFEGSQEDAPDAAQPVPGLGLLPGQVVRFSEQGGAGGEEGEGGGEGGERVKVPHMGWNTLAWDRDDPLLRGLTPGRDAVYFVHSYYARPVEADEAPITSARCTYGGPFTATLWRDNVWATQFHPEKSQRVGLRILQNFARL